MSLLESCPSNIESNKRSKDRRCPSYRGVCIIELSVFFDLNKLQSPWFVVFSDSQ